MAYAQFISTEYLFKWTIIPNNVDVNLLTKFIRKSQDTNIKDVLGYNLHTKLMNDLVAGGSTGTYLTLMNDYVMPALAEWTVFNALPFIHQRITNQSIVKKDSDNTEVSTLKEMEYLRDECKNSAEYYSEQIREFVINNESALPEYFTTVGIGHALPRASNYSTGIHLQKTTYYNGNIPIDYGNNPDNWPDNRN